MAIGDVTGGSSLAGQINFQGLGSGTDFGALIDKLVQVEQTRVKTYQTWKQSWLDKNTAFKDLNTKMLTLRTTLQGMDTVGEFLEKTATSSNTTALTATAGGDAQTGSVTYSIKQLAQNKTMVTAAGYANLTSNINTLGAAATFTYTYKGVTVSNAIPATASLTDLVNIINANGANNGVRASTIFDGSKYYLQMWGMDTGAAASLVVSGASTLPNFMNSDFQVTQANQDALFKINGWPLSNAYMSRPTNTVTDAVAGLTLNFKSSGAGTLNVATDVDAVVQNVKTFISQVNAVRQEITDLTKYDSTTKQASLLTGNYGLEIIGTIMNNITAAPGVGFDPTRDKYISLASLGLSTDATEGSLTAGQILLDETTLRNALASNADAAAKIFAAQYVGDTDSGDVTYSSYINNITKAGAYSVNYTVVGGKITSAFINGHAASFNSNSTFITGASGQDESGLVVRVNNLTDGTYNHTVNLRLGKTGELVNELGDLTNADTGPLNILQQNYQSIADDIQTKIDNENRRIQDMATHLKDQYSKLDALLGQYGQIQSQLASQITQLSSK